MGSNLICSVVLIYMVLGAASCVDSGTGSTPIEFILVDVPDQPVGCLPEDLFFVADRVEAGDEGICCGDLTLAAHAVYIPEIRACCGWRALVCISCSDGECSFGEDCYNCPSDCEEPIYDPAAPMEEEDPRYLHPVSDEVAECRLNDDGLWECARRTF